MRPLRFFHRKMQKSLGIARALCAIILFAASVVEAAGSEWDARAADETRVLIEGWTEYLHSWSIVNAHHLVHLHPFAASAPAQFATSDSDDAATECALTLPNNGSDGSHSRMQRPCRMRLHLFEMPPYIEHWTKAKPAFMLHSQEHATRLRSVPRLRPAKPLPEVSQGYIPPSSHYYDLVRIPNEPDDEPAVERFELRWRFDAIFRIAAPVNMYLPTPPASTRRRIIVSPHPPPQMFLFLTSEWRSLTAPDCIGGEFSSLIERARSGDIVLLTPSHWSQQAFIKHDIQTSVVLPHGVDTSVMRPGLRAEALEFHRRAGLPEAMVADARSFIFMMTGSSMTDNKNIRGLLHAFFMLADSNPHVYLILKMQHGLYAALANIEAKIRELEELGSADFSNRADITARIFYVTQDLTPAQMAALYNLADAYVTPYHAEAFNIPALEAAACGVPLIVPVGGATDDFVYAPSTVFIPTVIEALHEHNQGLVTIDSDVAIAMRRAIVHKHALKAAALRGVKEHVPRFSWEAIGRRLAFILTDPKHYSKRARRSKGRTSASGCPQRSRDAGIEAGEENVSC